MARWLLVMVAVGCWLGLLASPAGACPDCNPTGLTFSEEIATMDVAIIARLAKAQPAVRIPAPARKEGSDEIAKGTFEIVQILKGEGLVRKGDKIETLYFGDGKAGDSFLVMGVGPPKLQWSTPLHLSERAVKYLADIQKLPKQGAERLVFFQDYLQDADEHLAGDAYNEFARAAHAEVKDLKPRMDHDKVVAWVKDPEIPTIRRRLYLVMLGICGDERDLPMLEGILRSTDRKQRAGLDMVIVCYLNLKGEAGLALVEELFLANKKADYADTYAAIMAIRLQASDFGAIDKRALVKSLHPMLDRPELADLVIPDLAKWEDWAVMDRLFDLYKTADPKTSWLRVPVVNYLRTCPLPRAKTLLEECERIDPAAVKRAKTFFPVPQAVENTAG
jgi:hypothetical protein